jgi:RimJ/RimL family protein N-acetyltransferase
MQGRFCRLEILDAARHGADLFAANQLDAEGENWTHLTVGPFATLTAYRSWLEAVADKDDPLFYAIIDANSDKPVGVAAYMRVDRQNGVIEVGSLNYSPLLQRKPAATEAMFLMMARVFDELGYRRYEWKCDALNTPSRSAALRLGFQFEGIFRQAMVTKGRNRDTAWFSLLDSRWPPLKRGFGQWLAPANFDAEGRQRQGLAALIEAASR